MSRSLSLYINIYQSIYSWFRAGSWTWTKLSGARNWKFIRRMYMWKDQPVTHTHTDREQHHTHTLYTYTLYVITHTHSLYTSTYLVQYICFVTFGQLDVDETERRARLRIDAEGVMYILSLYMYINIYIYMYLCILYLSIQLYFVSVGQLDVNETERRASLEIHTEGVIDIWSHTHTHSLSL